MLARESSPLAAAMLSPLLPCVPKTLHLSAPLNLRHSGNPTLDTSAASVPSLLSCWCSHDATPGPPSEGQLRMGNGESRGRRHFSPRFRSAEVSRTTGNRWPLASRKEEEKQTQVVRIVTLIINGKYVEKVTARSGGVVSRSHLEGKSLPGDAPTWTAFTVSTHSLTAPSLSQHAVHTFLSRKNSYLPRAAWRNASLGLQS